MKYTLMVIRYTQAALAAAGHAEGDQNDQKGSKLITASSNGIINSSGLSSSDHKLNDIPEAASTSATTTSVTGATGTTGEGIGNVNPDSLNDDDLDHAQDDLALDALPGLHDEEQLNMLALNHEQHLQPETPTEIDRVNPPFLVKAAQEIEDLGDDLGASQDNTRL